MVRPQSGSSDTYVFEFHAMQYVACSIFSVFLLPLVFLSVFHKTPGREVQARRDVLAHACIHA